MQRPHIPPTMSRRMANIIHRLRLGFPCWEDIRDEVRGCEYCDAIPDDPLTHYLLHCPATDRLRQVMGLRGDQADPDDFLQAARAAKRLVGCQAALEVAIFFPPPR